MRCREAKRLMQMVLAGDGTAEDGKRLEEHMDRCHECAAQWQRTKSLAQALEAVRPEEPAAERDLSREVMQRLAARGSWLEGFWGSKPAQAAAAVVFVLACAGILAMSMPRMDVLVGAMSAMPTVPMP